jgi:hypothetical protein
MLICMIGTTNMTDSIVRPTSLTDMPYRVIGTTTTAHMAN